MLIASFFLDFNWSLDLKKADALRAKVSMKDN
jgi:hypothetical protein